MSVVLFTCLFKGEFTRKSKLSLPSRFTLTNLTLAAFEILVLVIRISTGKLELVIR